MTFSFNISSYLDWLLYIFDLVFLITINNKITTIFFPLFLFNVYLITFLCHWLFFWPANQILTVNFIWNTCLVLVSPTDNILHCTGADYGLHIVCVVFAFISYIVRSFKIRSSIPQGWQKIVNCQTTSSIAGVTVNHMGHGIDTDC